MNQFPIRSTWTFDEKKRFESALLAVPEGTPDRWVKVAEAVPGKTEAEVKARYRALENFINAIESGRVSVSYPGNGDRAVLSLDSGVGTSQMGSKREKKTGKWSEEEHRQFLEGLEKYGKGDWRSISRKCVVTRTPKQVASHAQKYFLRS